VSDFASLLRPFHNRINNMLARGKLSSVKADAKMQVLQLQLLDGEVKDRLEHFEPYGFSSHPNPGSAEAAVMFLDGDRSHGVVLVVADRKYRMKGMKQGEVSIKDDLGQTVHLTRDGIVVKGAGLPMTFEETPSVTFKADSFVRFETPRVECTQLLTSMQYQMGGVAGGLGALSAAFAGAMTWSGVDLQATGGSMKHNGRDFSGGHTHGGISSGSSNTAVPNP